MGSYSSGPLTAGDVLASLRKHASEYRRKLRFITVAMIMVGIGLVATVAFDRWGHTPAGWSSIVEYMPWFLVFVGGAAMTARQQLLTEARRVPAFGDKRMLGPIIELLDDQDEHERRFACQVVINLLPQFNNEDFSDLSSDQRVRLVKSICSCSDVDYVATVLGAAKKFGGYDCIAPMEEFANGQAALRKSDIKRTESMARMALADIRMRVARLHIEKVIATSGGANAERECQDVVDEEPQPTNVKSQL